MSATELPQDSSVKVYELAKELGLDSISLLNKLKTLNIQVKNHMSDLSDLEAQTARLSMKKGVAAGKALKKPAPRTKKKTTSEGAAASLADGAAGADKKVASPVIRRRTKEGTAGVGETSLLGSGLKRQERSVPESDALEETLDATSHPATATDEALSPAGLAGGEEHDASSVAESDLPLEAATSSEQVAAASASPEVTSQEGETAESGATPRRRLTEEEAQLSGMSGSTAEAVVPAKTKAIRPPIVLTPRPVAPRRSILKIVEALPPVPRPVIQAAATPTATPLVTSGPMKPIVKGAATQDKEGFRIIKMTKENLDQMVEEEAAKKRGTGREAEIRPEDVRFADYRKKELVFLPKKKKIPLGKEIKKTQKTVAKAQKRIVQMEQSISVQDLANQLAVKAADVMKKIMSMGQMATLHQVLDFDTATLIASEYQHEVRSVAFNESSLLEEAASLPAHMESRPPIVTIMGHVDHGKTTLLDAIRETNVVAGEAGGITQHLGAYTVQKAGKWITFIDTPGHEAFTVMRARGANVTDIVILVVSADDGVMPQTREALSHAQSAKVPIIVAVNKIDKPGANPEKIKQTLADLNLLSEDWGGETQFVGVSALKRTNLDQLLDAILLQAEILDLKADPSLKAQGTVLESRLEKGRGPVVSVLIRQGTLRVGDPIVAGLFAGKVKALTDDQGVTVLSAKPGVAVEVLGFEGLPGAGELFNATDEDLAARQIAANRQDVNRSKTSSLQSKVTLEQLFSKIQAGDLKELNVILKGDTFGSVEAIRDSLEKLATGQVKIKIVLAAPGGITESDVLLASAAGALILGFQVRPETKARQVAEAEHIEVKCYNVIYELIDDMKKAMVGLLDKKKVEKFLGRAEVRQTFTVPKIGTIAGSSVVDGKISRGAHVRLLRDSRIIFEGKMSSLRRFKDDTKEVTTGFECGIGIDNYNDMKPGDIIEAYQIELVTPELNP